MIRYRVLDLPVQGAGAFSPIPATNPVASSYGVVRVSAMLGTNPIPVESPASQGVVGISQDPKTQSSNVAPNVILPVKYVAHADNMGPERDAGIGMALRRLTPLPVPARSWRLAGKPTMRAPIVGGRTAMDWPRAFQRWGN